MGVLLLSDSGVGVGLVQGDKERTGPSKSPFSGFW